MAESVSSHPSEQQFLSFPLPPSYQAMLPAEQLSEIISLAPAQIIPIPEMSPAVMGVFNWRGEVLWLVDLGYLLGFPPLFHQPHRRPTLNALILSHQGQTLGVVVEQLAEMIWCDRAQIQSPPIASVTPELAPYLQGYWLHRDKTWLVLDGTAIVASFSSTLFKN